MIVAIPGWLSFCSWIKEDYIMVRMNKNYLPLDKKKIVFGISGYSYGPIPSRSLRLVA